MKEANIETLDVIHTGKLKSREVKWLELSYRTYPEVHQGLVMQIKETEGVDV